MRFARQRPVKVVMLGAGGTGGHIATHLYRLLCSLGRPVRFIICDGDIVMQKNLVRQNFAPADLGENKAKVLAERYSTIFGMETEYVPDFIETEDRLTELLTPEHWAADTRHYDEKMGTYVHDTITELVILVGAVDNNKSRRLCHEVFFKSRDLIYIDSGNGEQTGQVVCGVRQADRTMFQPVGTLYPDILEDIDKFPSELSCAEASVSAPQSIMANVMAATTVLCVIYNILTDGENVVRKATFSTKTAMVRTELATKRVAVSSAA